MKRHAYLTTKYLTIALTLRKKNDKDSGKLTSAHQLCQKQGYKYLAALS